MPWNNMTSFYEIFVKQNCSSDPAWLSLLYPLTHEFIAIFVRLNAIVCLCLNDRRFTRWISQNFFSQPFGEFCIILRLKIKQFIARYLSVTIAWNELILTCYICLEFDWLKLPADCTIAAFRDSMICKNRCVSSVSLKRSL